MASWRSFKGIPGPLQLLLLLYLLPWGLVVTGQNLEITQCPEKISVNAGENLILMCILTGPNIPGGVRWYKGKDRSQAPIYSDKQGSSNRGLRLNPGSSRDFSINIQNVRPEDAGTYYCVKFRAGVPERELVSGKGTVVSMIVPPKVRLETNPSSPVQLNTSVLVTCNAESFFPDSAKVELFAKDAPGRKGKVDATISNPDGTFTLKSNLEVMATEDRNLSMFLCQVQHDSQPLVNESTTLLIRMQPDDNRMFSDGSESSPPQPSLLVLWIPLFLTKASFFSSLVLF